MSEMVAELKAAATVPPRSADLLWCAGFGGIVPFVSARLFLCDRAQRVTGAIHYLG